MKKNLMAMAVTHLQVILGLVLYFQSAKVANRFFAVEHFSLMLLAAILITIGYSWSKRTTENKQGVIAFAFYLAGLLSILGGIPWPWMDYGTGWF